jgi:hypothetical protein
MRRLSPQETKRVGEFRLLRLDTDVNLARFTKHVAKLQHRLYWDLSLRQIKIKSRRARQAAKRASLTS